MLTITLRPNRIARTLALVVLVLAAASVAGQVVRYRATNQTVQDLALLLKLSAEHTIPAYFSALMLLGSAGLLWMIARVAQRGGRPFVRHWRWLAIIFVYLSVDESCSIHELAIEPMQRVLGDRAVGLLHYAWVVPGAAVVLGLGLVYLRFVLHLPAGVRNRVIAAGALYVGGAIGMEMIGAYFASTSSTRTMQYAASALVEEMMEMFGVVLFIHVLLIHLAGRGGVVRVSLDEAPGALPAPTSTPQEIAAVVGDVRAPDDARKPMRSFEQV